MTNEEKIRNRFAYHAPSPEGVSRHGALTGGFVRIAEIIEDVVPNGREKNAAMKYLENAKMWASAGVARNPETR